MHLSGAVRARARATAQMDEHYSHQSSNVYSTQHEHYECDSEQSFKKPSLLVRLHHALSAVRGGARGPAQQGARPALSNVSQHDEGAAPIARKEDDHVVFRNVLMQLQSSTREERLEILEGLPELITRQCDFLKLCSRQAAVTF